jgi:hypothetical protein
MGGVLSGAYLLSLGINYLPLLMYAIAIVRAGSAEAGMPVNSNDRQRMFRRYRRQSLWLLVPLVVPILAIRQEWQARRKMAQGG